MSDIFKATSQPIFARKPCQKPYVSYVFCLLSICKRTPLLDTEGFYLLAWLTPHQQRLVRAVAFRFARRRPVLPCLCKRADSL